MDLVSPKKNEIDGSSVASDHTEMLSLPYIFAGRAFNQYNDFFFDKMLDFHETFLRTPDIGMDKTSSCKCAGFLKCQHVIIHNPSIMISEFAQKTWVKILENGNKTNMLIRQYPIKAGNSSSTECLRLVYRENEKEYPLLMTVFMTCHIDPTTHRQITMCNAKRNWIEHHLSKRTKEELTEIDTFYQELSGNMDSIKSVIGSNDDESQCLFECKLQIQHTDLDWNMHVNQSVYAKYIENALVEYRNAYDIEQYHVAAITANYVHEITIGDIKQRDGLPFCNVKILKDNVIVAKKQRFIFGIIEYDGVLCLEFKLKLIEYKHDRLFRVRSRL